MNAKQKQNKVHKLEILDEEYRSEVYEDAEADYKEVYGDLQTDRSGIFNQ